MKEWLFLPLVKGDWYYRYLIKVMLLFGLEQMVDFALIELRTNFGVMGNIEDRTELRKPFKEAGEYNLHETLNYIHRVWLRYLDQAKSQVIP